MDQVKFEGEQTVTRIVVLPGDWSTTEAWRVANRPKELEIRFGDGTEQTWMMTDSMVPQTLVLAKPVNTNSVRFMVKRIFGGSTFADTAISEIRVYDDQTAGVVLKEATASSEYRTDKRSSYAPIMGADGVKDTYWCEGNSQRRRGRVDRADEGEHLHRHVRVRNGASGRRRPYRRDGQLLGQNLPEAHAAGRHETSRARAETHHI